ncbi:hypothetical protein [Chitinophaga silvisoli]|uniref:hypothetical protein n=1 Tax=Chitinophaga silvisoli TaxID=2291814 RepID=UPI0018F14E82|nr:hypothetical protein [Chitinophaga silvisoli]
MPCSTLSSNARKIKRTSLHSSRHIPLKGIADIYYNNLSGKEGFVEALACYGWGWASSPSHHSDWHWTQ